MKSKKVIYPKVVAGGKAVPLGDNFYYMTGRKHKDGGIDVGANPKSGLEVEDEEVMHLTDKEVKVFSSVPFLKGESPAQKVLGGHNPTKVFKEQQNYKQVNGINDDGTKKQFGGKAMKPKYAGGGKIKRNTNTLAPLKTEPKIYTPSISTYDSIKLGAQSNIDNMDTGLNVGTVATPKTKVGTFLENAKIKVMKAGDAIDKYDDEHQGRIGDAIGIGSNIISTFASNRANNKMLDKLKYSAPPVARTAPKLKTTININPQVNKMRETIASYERDIDNNTASSRVALARKQKVRSAGIGQTNELFGQKENTETELINQDKLNQQRTSDANIGEYNNWAQGKAQFENTVAEKRSENRVGLIDNLNAGVQDFISRGEKRNANNNNMLALSAGNPNVNPRILKELGVTSITDKHVADWERAHPTKAKGYVKPSTKPKTTK